MGMISKRLLTKWRREALQDLVMPKMLASLDGVNEEFHIDEVQELSKRILQMTQELLDQHLLQKEVK